MKMPVCEKETARLVLGPLTAADLMMPNPMSIGADGLVREAIAFLIDKGFSAAPVIDEAGRPVGVLSRSDIMARQRAKRESVPREHEYYGIPGPRPRSGMGQLEGPALSEVDTTLVRDIMTPLVFSVPPEAPASKVVGDMLALHVHRLFVVDRDGVLIGVINALDVLRHLQPE